MQVGIGTRIGGGRMPIIRNQTVRPQPYGPMRAVGTQLNGGSFSSNEGAFDGINTNPNTRMLLRGGSMVDAFNDYTSSGMAEPDYFQELGTIRNNTRNLAQSNLDAYGNDLSMGLDEYASSQGGLIDSHASGLDKYRSDYLSQTNADLAEDEERRRKLRLGARNASRLAVKGAINEGTRNAKAMFAQRGGAGSSYASRLGMGIAAKANIDAENQLSQMDREDALAMTDAKRRRDALMFDTGRSDLSRVYGDRSRLSSDVFGRRMDNRGRIYGEQSRINTNDANAERADIAATRIITPKEGSLLSQPENNSFANFLFSRTRRGRIPRSSRFA